MNLLEQENYEFIRDTLQGKCEVRYGMPKDAKFLVMQNGKMMVKTEVDGDKKVVGYYVDGKNFYFDNFKANKRKTGFREVLRKQVDLV